jgi:hypothetical protein
LKILVVKRYEVDLEIFVAEVMKSSG